MAVISGQPNREEVESWTIPVIYAAQLAQVVARWNVPSALLLEGSGITPELLEVPEARASLSAMRHVIENALRLTGEPGLGFYFGLQLRLSSHGIVGFAAMTSATLRDAIQIAVRYFGLRASHLALRLETEGDQAVLELIEIEPFGNLRVFLVESMLTALVQMAKTIVGEQLSGRAEVVYPEPEHFQGFSHLWAGAARFEQPANRLIFPATFLDCPLQMADAVATRQALDQCERELANLGETSSLLASVRRQLRLRRSYPTLTELARERHVSPRTLKRQLADHGTSFRQLLDELRRDRALDMLEDPSVTTDSIAEHLGYSDASNFHRAFRRWVGMSPSAWRETHAIRAKA